VGRFGWRRNIEIGRGSAHREEFSVVENDFRMYQRYRFLLETQRLSDYEGLKKYGQNMLGFQLSWKYDD
jgi:hypothetical protein